ncbi:MAG: hypothetical protein FWC80_06195 [Firmicutes bacterium]|nr:hypothetical protein [Bacillota bacterium]
MDTKITRDRIDAHLEYDWFKYILILILAIALWIFAFQMINQSRPYEEITIFVAGMEQQGRAEHELGRAFDGDGVIRDVRFVSASESDAMIFHAQLSTVGMITSDILILPRNLLLTDYNFAAYGMVIIDDYLRERVLPYGIAIDDERFLRDRDDAIRGIRVDDLPNAEHFFRLETERTIGDGDDEEIEKRSFYMVINPRSVNIGAYSNRRRARAEHEQAIYAFRFLLEMMS